MFVRCLPLCCCQYYRRHCRCCYYIIIISSFFFYILVITILCRITFFHIRFSKWSEIAQRSDCALATYTHTHTLTLPNDEYMYLDLVRCTATAVAGFSMHRMYPIQSVCACVLLSWPYPSLSHALNCCGTDTYIFNFFFLSILWLPALCSVFAMALSCMHLFIFILLRTRTHSQADAFVLSLLDTNWNKWREEKRKYYEMTKEENSPFFWATKQFEVGTCHAMVNFILIARRLLW